MKRLPFTTMPDGAGVTLDQKIIWIRDQITRINLASRRDEDLDTIRAKTADLHATVAYNPASIAAGALGAIQTAAVAGAALGNPVVASFSLDTQGILVFAWVSAADTVKFAFFNPTAGALDLAAGNVSLRVWTYMGDA